MTSSTRQKARSRFVCRDCGYESAGWMGRCPDCGSWNGLDEELAPVSGRKAAGFPRMTLVNGGTAQPVRLAEVDSDRHERLSTGLAEVDRVLGGGLVPGSVVLVGGDPGIGKSTLLLQVSRLMGGRPVVGHPVAGHPVAGAVLYVSGEESGAQVRLRADRLGPVPETLYVLTETDVNRVAEAVLAIEPAVLIVDSIQTLFTPDLENAPGSVSQVRATAAVLTNLAKARGMATFLVGHINKDGALAGPKVLEHMVDAVLYLEGERHYSYRILRGVKNRFGSTNEIGVFAMAETGLQEIPNPSEFFLSERPAGVAGSVVVAGLEGSRPVLVEVQALVSGPNYGTPRRAVTGMDYNRVALIMAVLEKRAGLSLGSYDTYVKVAGGLRLDEPAVDLGVAIALASAFRDRAVAPTLVVTGEVGLGGEVRAVPRVQERLKEAERLGFRRFMLPKKCLPVAGTGSSGSYGSLDLAGVDDIGSALEESLDLS